MDTDTMTRVHAYACTTAQTSAIPRTFTVGGVRYSVVTVHDDTRGWQVEIHGEQRHNGTLFVVYVASAYFDAPITAWFQAARRFKSKTGFDVPADN